MKSCIKTMILPLNISHHQLLHVLLGEVGMGRSTAAGLMRVTPEWASKALLTNIKKP